MSLKKQMKWKVGKMFRPMHKFRKKSICLRRCTQTFQTKFKTLEKQDTWTHWTRLRMIRFKRAPKRVRPSPNHQRIPEIKVTNMKVAHSWKEEMRLIRMRARRKIHRLRCSLISSGSGSTTPLKTAKRKKWTGDARKRSMDQGLAARYLNLRDPTLRWSINKVTKTSKTKMIRMSRRSPAKSASSLALTTNGRPSLTFSSSFS